MNDTEMVGVQDVRVVVFDLGGVLVQLGGVDEMARLSGMTLDALWQRWLSCRWVRTLELGHCTPDEFAAGLVADWELPMAPSDFLAAFRGWPVGTEPGAAELVAAVRANVPTVCLSNSNALHWDDQIERGFGLERIFDRHFLSHEMARVKPDPEVFEHVAAELEEPAGALLLLDDTLANVEAARQAGWQAAHVRGIDAARAALERHGVLPVTPSAGS